MAAAGGCAEAAGIAHVEGGRPLDSMLAVTPTQTVSPQGKVQRGNMQLSPQRTQAMTQNHKPKQSSCRQWD